MRLLTNQKVTHSISEGPMEPPTFLSCGIWNQKFRTMKIKPATNVETTNKRREKHRQRWEPFGASLDRDVKRGVWSKFFRLIPIDHFMYSELISEMRGDRSKTRKERHCSETATKGKNKQNFSQSNSHATKRPNLRMSSKTALFEPALLSGDSSWILASKHCTV